VAGRADGLPETVTPPTVINRWASVRLATMPRRTSSASSLRRVGTLGLFFEGRPQPIHDGISKVGGLGRIGGLEGGEERIDGRIIHGGHYPHPRRQDVPLLPIRDVNPTLIRPLVTWAIIGVNVAVLAVVQPSASPAADEFAYRNAAIACELTTGAPLDTFEIGSGVCLDRRQGDQPFPNKNVWLAVVVSMFLHAGFAHILFNMWSMWIFGNNVEEAYGHLAFALFYVAAGIAATAGFVLLEPETTVPLVGASGAIAGVMGAYLILFPRHLVLTLVFIRAVAIPSVAYLGLWFASQFLFVGEASGIAWQAHVAGFVFGAAVTLLLRDRLLARVGGVPAAAY